MFSRAAKTPVPFIFFVLGAVLYWAAIPPLGIWPLTFLVPVAWAVTIGHAEKLRFRTVYFGAFLFWLASIWWIACPHPATFVGLLALSAYLAIYWPMFFSASRFAVHRLKIPAVLAMPVCWIGCEYLRNHLLGGFSFCSLEHALYLQPVFIQIADISGGYLVGGMVMLVGAGAAEKLVSVTTSSEKPESLTSKELLSGVLAVVVLLASVFYGVHIVKQPVSRDTPAFRIAAIQGNIPVKLDADQERNLATYKQFVDLTVEAVQAAQSNGKPLDLVVWPETVCPVPYLQFYDVDPTEFGWTDELTDIWTRELGFLQNMVRQLDTPLLVGLSTLAFEKPPEPTRLNSALLLRPDTESDRPLYSKVHLVMFGEYIPFSKYLPDSFFIKTLCQEAGRGTGPVAFPLSIGGATGDWGMVNICFESTIPHLVRKQVTSFPEARLLINMSNDGWFRFSQQVDQHLATHVFRAVENRRPYVTATNGGFSAVIDNLGRIQAMGKRGAAEAVTGTVVLEHGSPIYHRIGDAIPLACALCLVGLLVLRLGMQKLDTDLEKR